MLYTKACPRCSGDIKLDRDNYGVYAKCLQCGFNRDFKTRKEDMPGMNGAETAAGPDLGGYGAAFEEEHLDAA